MARRLLRVLILSTLLTSMGRSQTFSDFLQKLSAASDTSQRTNLIDDFLTKNPPPVFEGNHVHFLYRGKAKSAAVPGEMNNWTPSKGLMESVPKTNLWYRTETFPENARVEYKLWVDSSWMLDPANPKISEGAFGPNSEVWMPAYRPSPVVEYNRLISHGNIETLWIKSKFLKQRHPVIVYRPKGTRWRKVPVVYVTDGGEYMLFGKMINVLDNLISQERIRPIIAVFMDPRTDLDDNRTNRRMTEYAANDSFLNFVEKEVAPLVERRYPASKKAGERLILGASMGGLIATYAVLTRPAFFGNCAAQSPAYRQADSTVVKFLEKKKKITGKFYIDTGTIYDTQEEARLVSEKLKQKGAEVIYSEYSEGHNWKNWRARLDKILEYFFPME